MNYKGTGELNFFLEMHHLQFSVEIIQEQQSIGELKGGELNEVFAQYRYNIPILF